MKKRTQKSENSSPTTSHKEASDAAIESPASAIEASSKAKDDGDPIIAFRIPVEINNEVEILKHYMFTQDGGKGTRTDVGRSLFVAILKRHIVESITELSRARGEPFANTLHKAVQIGLESMKKDKK